MPTVLSGTVKFRSENRSLKLIRQSQVDRLTEYGRMAMVAPEVSYQFELGWLEVRPGEDVLADGPWDPDTGAPTEIDGVTWLRLFSEENGRYAEVLPEARPASELLHELAEAQLAGDLDRVQEIGDLEASTFKRPEVLSRAKAAYDALLPDK